MTNVVSNRNSTTTTTATTNTPSNGTIPKTSQQTPISQPRSKSPSTNLRDQSPTPLSPKPIGSGVASLREQFDSIEHSPSITTSTTKTPLRAKSPVSSVPNENSIRSSSTPTHPSTPIKETSPIPTIVTKPNETLKTVETIPKFYFPSGELTSPTAIETLVNKTITSS